MTPDLAAGAGAPMHYRVLGPDTGGVSVADLRRLFRGQRLTPARRGRLQQGSRILALCGCRVVGLAAYDRSDRELRVEEVGLDTTSACAPAEIADGLLDALELGCVAGSVRRLVLLPRTDLMDDVLHKRGYAAIARVTAGTWYEKRFV
ncbi:MAG: hypothetical protein MUE61_05190 [Vicinamibacterales bacterium]|nr:hypothetical protein [Vicinamibacterales bacterium]